MLNHLGAEEDDKFDGARDPGVLGLAIYIYISIHIFDKFDQITNIWMVPGVQEYWACPFLFPFLFIFFDKFDQISNIWMVPGV